MTSQARRGVQVILPLRTPCHHGDGFVLFPQAASGGLRSRSDAPLPGPLPDRPLSCPGLNRGRGPGSGSLSGGVEVISSLPDGNELSGLAVQDPFSSPASFPAALGKGGQGGGI